MEDNIIQEIRSAWVTKVRSKADWPGYKRTVLKIPDKVSGITKKYFQSLCENILSLDLESQEDFSIAVDFFNSLLVIRKSECVIESLKKFENKSITRNLVKNLNPLSVFLLSLFKNSDYQNFIEFFDTPSLQTEDFLSFHLPFKVHSVEETEKLTRILLKYSLGVKSLQVIVKAWSDPMFLMNSLWHNKPLTILIHNLMNKDLPSAITTELYQGIQIRLSSNNKEISLSGLVILIQLIASRVAQLLNSTEIIKYTLEDYLAGNEASEDSESDQEAEVVNENVPYLEELLNGLTSSDRTRFIQALNSSPSLILENLADLDLNLPSLSSILLRLENKFSVANFEELRFQSLVNLTYLRPIQMIQIFTNKLKEISSIGDFVLAMDILKESSSKLASYQEKSEKNPGKGQSKYSAIQERLKKKTKYFFKSKKPNFSMNLFLPHFPAFVSSILSIVTGKLDPIILSKIFYTLSEILENTGGTCDYPVVQSCVYIVKCLKGFINHTKREVSESAIYLLINVSSKINNSSLLKDFESLLLDLQEISFKLEQVPPELKEIATQALILIA